MSSGFWVVIGVVLGFALGEGSRYLRYRWSIHIRRKIIREELSSIKGQIPQKKDILQQAIHHLQNGRLMPTRAVRILGIGYKENIVELYPHLSELERNCLHVVYGRLSLADDVMDTFEQDYLSAVREKIMDNPNQAYLERLSEMYKSYEIIDQLIDAYLHGRLIDVFHVGEPDGSDYPRR